MYNFTPRAKQVLELALREARRMNHGSAGTEHLLLGSIMLGEGVSFGLLKSRGLDLETVRVTVERQVKINKNTPLFEFDVYTPGFKSLLALADREARMRNQEYITTEYLLLGLLLEGEGVPSQVFKTLSVDVPLTIEELVKQLPPKQATSNIHPPTKNRWILVLSSWFIYGAIGPTILAVFWNIPKPNSIDHLMGGLGFLCSTVFYLTGHELSHAAVAHLVGFPILRISFGWPGKNYELQFFGITWRLDSDVSYVGAANVSLFYMPSRFLRLKAWLTIAAGPAYNIGFFVLSFLGLYLCMLAFQPVPNGTYYVISFLAGWFLHATFGLFQSFSYTTSNRKGKLVNSDLKQLVRIPFETKENLFKKTITSRLELIRLGRTPSLSDKELKEIMDTWEKNDAMLLYLSQKVDSNNDAITDICKRVITMNLSKADRILAIDRYLTNLITYERVSREPQVDSLSQELLHLTNNAATARGTRGSLLVELNRLEEGKAMLTEVIRESSSIIDQFFSHAYLAIAEKRLGNQVLVETHREAARQSGYRKGLAGPLWKRIEQL